MLDKEVKRRNTFLYFVVDAASDQVQFAMLLHDACVCAVRDVVRLQVVAYIIFTTAQLVIQITKLGVHPSFRRQGIARNLLQVME